MTSGPEDAVSETPHTERSPSACEVAVVVLNWRNAGETIECIRHVCSLFGSNWRLIICDNGSADGSLERIREEMIAQLSTGRVGSTVVGLSRDDLVPKLSAEDRLVVVDNRENIGFAAGNNVGIRIALADPACLFVWILNNDTRVEPGALAALVAQARLDPQAGIVGSTLVYNDRPDIVQSLGGSLFNRWTCTSHYYCEGMNLTELRSKDASDMIDYVAGASMLLTRRFLETVGCMSEDYFLYYEEIDWALRARAAGFRLRHAPDSIVRHVESATIGFKRGNIQFGGIGDFYQMRNRLLFARKNMPTRVPFVVAGLLLILAAAIVRGRWKRVTMMLAPRFWFSRGRVHA